MSRKMVQRFFVICVLALVAVASCFAQGHAALVGKWNMVSESQGDPVNWTFVVKDTDGKLAGFLTTDESEQAAKDFAYANGVITFKAPYQGQDYAIELKLIGDKLDGTWSGGGDSGKTSGTKAK